MKNTRMTLAALAACALMAGCSGIGQPAVGPTGAPLGGTCDARPAQSAVGQSSTASVVETARVRSGAQMVRIIRPGQMITKEYDAQRLNLEVDANGRILAVRCG